MPYIRRLPSGLWQATIRGPDGHRHTETDPLRRVVKAWALAQEAAIARGAFRDPRLGEIKVGDWYARVSAARSIANATGAKHLSLWRTHCGPQWAMWAMGGITRMEAQEWAKKLSAAKRARHRGRMVTAESKDIPALAPETVAAAVHLMSALYTAAMKETPPLVLSNPFAHLELPGIAPSAIDFLEPGEAMALYEAAERLHGLRWRTLIGLGTEVGLRPGELYGLHGHRVDQEQGVIQVIDVMTRTGLRRWPKTKRSHRIVPVPPRILEGIAVLMDGRPKDAIVFTAPEGGAVDDGNFRDRIWYTAVGAARLCGMTAPSGREEFRATVCGPEFCDDPAHRIRRFPPRIMRHTAASWLVQDGVPLYDVQALLGHESFRTTERYAHLAPGAHGKVTESWTRRLDAPLTHEPPKGS